jgi:argininosuccinate synthase
VTRVSSRRIVLAYSGGRTTSAAVSWLAQSHDAEVVALTLDTGRGRELEVVRDRALADGAVRAHVLDVREELARAFLLPALKAGALYDEGGRALTASLGRALVAQKLVEISAIEQAATVAHGSAAGDHIASAVRALNPALAVVAAPRVPSPHAIVHSARPAEYPAEPASVEITFSRGTPAALNGITMALVDLIGSLDILAGAHGVGRVDGLETPGVRVLHEAAAVLRLASLPDPVARFWPLAAREYIAAIDSGQWFGAHRHALDAYVEKASAAMTGVVRLKLFNGTCETVDARVHDPRLESDEHAVVRPLRFRA